jgi:hypothetical protein
MLLDDREFHSSLAFIANASAAFLPVSELWLVSGSSL